MMERIKRKNPFCVENMTQMSLEDTRIPLYEATLVLQDVLQYKPEKKKSFPVIFQRGEGIS